VRAWRLARKGFARLGAGARLYGGRWNRRGQAVVYSSEHLSLAVLEVIVHLELALEDFPADYAKIAIEVPDALWIERIQTLPRTAAQAVEIGANWYDSGRAVGLLVRSVMIPEEHNLLLNPGHPDFERIRAWPADLFASIQDCSASPDARNESKQGVHA
jgi:RES domain-containing protein